MSITIGIIGGSGLYDMAELTDRRERLVDTPYGPPSGPYITGLLARHPVSRSSPAMARGTGSRPRS